MRKLKGIEDGSWKMEVTIRGKKNFQTEKSVEKKKLFVSLIFRNLQLPSPSFQLNYLD
ncbi:hypothetical protein [Chryseobacterium sp. WLY505]|uniref:hypothetical protein n=1 Tax=Chryseobacterium sp. WLY505 TaxID=3068892 RepID=UPI0027969CA7|nr:hypothetical protein [Chryseobacterium sp. WLY505]MDQ1855002.1 hypothetical protein [Chryseobacterium sp. WLY505]